MALALATIENVRNALGYISPDLEREEWAKIGMSIKDGLNGEGFELFNEWSKTGTSYNKDDVTDTWHSIKAGGGVTVGTLFYFAGQNGWKPDRTAEPETEAQRKEREKLRNEKVAKEVKATESKAKAAAGKTKTLSEAAVPAQADHPYLVRKGVKPVTTLLEIPAEQAAQILGYAPKSDGKLLAGRLLIAQVEINGKLSTAELIDEEGKKSAIAGGTKSSGYWSAQPLPANDDVSLAFTIGEGIATVLSAHEAKGYFSIAALSASNIPKVAKYIKDHYPASNIIILADVGNGQKYAEQAAIATGATLAIPSFTPEQIQQFQNTNKNDKPPTDFNDLHLIAGLDVVLAQISDVENLPPVKAIKSKPAIDFDERIYDFPHTKDNGQKNSSTANLRHLLNGYGIKVSYDEMLKEQKMVFGNEFDNAHADLLESANLANLNSLVDINGMNARIINLLPSIFSSNAVNPIINLIKSKEWDGVDRIINLADTLTVSDNDKSYAYVALKTWLVQCVAAADGARHAGNKNAIAKYELVFILQGGQGARKTSWFQRLLPVELKKYILDGVHLDPGNKDSVKQAVSCWICELGELDSTFRRSDIAQLKAFLSKQSDTLRLPYDRAASSLGRRVSFCGSVNPEMFLVDATGNRRFLPVQIIACDSLHTINMQQLWAQVWQLYLDGAQWWCSEELEELLKARHERHSETVPVNELIAEAFDIEKIEKGLGHKHYTATRVLIECGIKEPKTNQASIVNAYLKKLGFEQVQANGVKGFWLEKRPYQPN